MPKLSICCTPNRFTLIIQGMRSAAFNAGSLLLSGLLSVGPAAIAHGQQSGSTAPSSQGQAQPSSPDDNSFPEDVSRKAAKDAAAQKKKENQPPATDAQQDATPQPAGNSDSNPFPEDTSRKAAADAKGAESGGSSSDRGSDSGVSSSGDYDRRTTGNGRTALPTNVPMPHVQGKDPAKEDVSVGTYYLQSGDFRGAYQRFKEATQLAPENMDAVFGLAEAARHLKKLDEARTNYQLFLQVVASGSKAKEARKAVASLGKAQ